MDELNLIGRIEKFNKKINMNINPFREREEFRMLIRKEKMHNFFEKKRIIPYKSSFEIDIENLNNISDEIKLMLTFENDISSTKQYLMTLLNTSNIQYIKYTLAKLKQMLFVSSDYSKELIDTELVECLIKLLENKKDYSVFYETLCCLNFCVLNKNQQINERILTPTVLNTFNYFFERYLLGSFFDDIINFIILLIGNLIIDNIVSKQIILKNFTIIDKITELLQNEYDEIRIDVLKNSVFLLSNVIKGENIPFKVSSLSLDIFLKYTNKNYLSKIKLVSLHNIPFQDDLLSINNIKNTVTFSFQGIFEIIKKQEIRLIEKIVKHNLIEKLYNLGLNDFEENDLLNFLKIITGILSLDQDNFVEVYIIEKDNNPSKFI